VQTIERLAKSVPLDAPWTAPNASMLDSQLLGDWLNSNMTSGGAARALIETGIASIQSAPSTNISLLWFLFFVHSGGSWNRLQSIENGAQESRFVGGSHLLSEKMATELGDNLLLGNPVSNIEQEHGEVSLDLRYGEIKAQRAIVAMMPADANNIKFEPSLPHIRKQLNANWASASGVKIHAIYRTPFWRDLGLSGQAFTDTPVSTIFDNSPDDASFGVLLAFIEPEQLPIDPLQRKLEVLRISDIKYYIWCASINTIRLPRKKLE